MTSFDLIVIGSGPGGEKAAMQAAKLGKRVLVVDRGEQPGGACMHTGTVPSKTLRESVRFISAIKQRSVYGISVHQDEHLTVNSLMHRKRGAIGALVERLESNFERNDVDYVKGTARFEDPHHIQVTGDAGTTELYEGKYIIIATGSRPYRPDFLDFSNPRVLDADTVLSMHHIPKSITIIGAGVIGCEYATIFSNLGVKVNLVNPRQVLLDFLDQEISNALDYLMRDRGVRIRLNEVLSAVECQEHEVLAHLESGKVLKSEFLLYANGRTGNTEKLGLERIGVKANKRQQLEVNAFYQVPQHGHVYAVGDVIGLPSLAATSMDQGRLAAKHAFSGIEEKQNFNLMPTGIYTIPEISFVGATEQTLTRDKVPYEVGLASYKEIARGQITGNTTGRLKLLFHRETLKVLGVHILGDEATDLIHIGQAVMTFGGTIEYFIDSVLNYPTFSECYRVAALNGYNRL
jgi:NAD(P) transhydrogenase